MSKWRAASGRVAGIRAFSAGQCSSGPNINHITHDWYLSVLTSSAPADLARASLARILAKASETMARCDFEIIDDDQDEPAEKHMYMLQTLTVPELTRMVTGTTSSESVPDLLAEAARICKGVYHEDGIQVRCVAVWLHAARLKPLVMQQLGPPVVFGTVRATAHTSSGDAAAEGFSA